MELAADGTKPVRVRLTPTGRRWYGDDDKRPHKNLRMQEETRAAAP